MRLSYNEIKMQDQT